MAFTRPAYFAKPISKSANAGLLMVMDTGTTSDSGKSQFPTIQQPIFAMTTKLITAVAITLMLAGCRSRKIRESHVITDFSKPVTLTFKLRSGNANAGYIIKGHMNGTMGYSEGVLSKGVKPHYYGPTCNLNNLDTATLRKYVLIHSDSIAAETNSSIGQSGLTSVLYIIPGSATEGKIEVMFWEHPIGFY